MTWDEFLNKSIESPHNGQVLTDIDCPECGRKIYFDSTVTLTSYPAQFCYWCSCGWVGTAHERWYKGVSNEVNVLGMQCTIGRGYGKFTSIMEDCPNCGAVLGKEVANEVRSSA